MTAAIDEPVAHHQQVGEFARKFVNRGRDLGLIERRRALRGRFTAHNTVAVRRGKLHRDLNQTAHDSLRFCLD
jgi:hypothetical protein